MQGFYTVMTSVGARMGTAVIAGHAIARQCSSLEALVVDGLAVAGLHLPSPPPFPPPPPSPPPLSPPPPGFLTSLFFSLSCSLFPSDTSLSVAAFRWLLLCLRFSVWVGGVGVEGGQGGASLMLM